MSIESLNHQSGSKDRKVKNFIIYPKFQWSLILTLAGMNLLTFVLVGIQGYRTITYIRGLGEAVGLPATHNYFRFVQLQANSLFINLGIAVLAAFIVGSVISIILSHRVAGPIVRLRGYFRKIAETKSISEDLYFRENDYFSDLPSVVNEALKKIKQ